MDTRTARIYERRAREWTARRSPRAITDGRLAAFARRLTAAARVLDLGCGPGWNSGWLNSAGFHAVALDASAAMLGQVPAHAPGVARVRGDLAALPLRDRSAAGAWANACYQHLPCTVLPMALARLHWALQVGAPVEITLARFDDRITPRPFERKRGEAQRRVDHPPFRGRLFSFHSPERAHDLMVGAGFEDVEVELLKDGFWMAVRAQRARTLPDLVTSRLRLLICGLNPSLYSADRGVGFARPGNRFWPAMRAAGLVDKERDPLHALARGIGMTDLVKRATVGADELSPDEYAKGFERLERLVHVHRPRVVCFVGLDGWRKVIDRRGQAGWAERKIGGRPAYLMPSTSGRNARAPLALLADNLRRAAATIGNKNEEIDV